MHHAQVLVYEADGKLAQRLTQLAGQRGVRLRELRKVEACLSSLRRHGPGSGPGRDVGCGPVPGPEPDRGR